MRAEWKCASVDNGEQYVMTPGISEMQVLPADNLDSPQNVRGIQTAAYVAATNNWVAGGLVQG